MGAVMSNRRDDWDGDEREALDGLERSWPKSGGRHQDDPSLAMLRAADKDALPHDLQARVDRHLRESPWSRALGRRPARDGADDHLDAESEERLLERISRAARPSTRAAPGRPWKPRADDGRARPCRSLLVAVVVSRPRIPTVDEPAAVPIAQRTTTGCREITQAEVRD
jgi:hypothetical protein